MPGKAQTVLSLPVVPWDTARVQFAACSLLVGRFETGGALTRGLGTAPGERPMKIPPIDARAPGHDQRVIDLLMSGEQVQGAKLDRSDLTWEAVRLRGEELGMSPRFIKDCRLAGTRPAMRTCVNCDLRFLSAGSHNRLCGRCRRL